MSDLIEELRHWNPVTFPLTGRAADEIERLRRELAEARGLLRECRHTLIAIREELTNGGS